jgi:hypothetical protein
VLVTDSWQELGDDKWGWAVSPEKKEKKTKGKKRMRLAWTLLTHGRFGHFGRACVWAGLGHAALNTRRTRRADAGCGRLGRFCPSSVRRLETFFFFYSFSNLTENCLLFCLKI